MRTPSRLLPLVLLLTSPAALLACDDHTAGVAPATVAPASEPAPTGAAASPPGTPAPGPSAEGRTTLRIDPAASSVGFTGAKVTGSHDGSFTSFEGTIELDRANVTASAVRVSIEMSSLVLEPPRLRNHLLTDDFFDVAQFPTASFASTAVAEGATGTVGGVAATHTVTGDLTLHGRTRSITFPIALEVTDAGVRARAEFTINRRDFDIVYPGMPDDLIRDEVVIRFDVRTAAG